MRTIRWARQCKAEYLDQLEHAKIRDDARPKLFAVIQGGGYPDLRKACAEALLEIGFDGFGFGGWPLDKQGALLEDISGIYAQPGTEGLPDACARGRASKECAGLLRPGL